MLLFSFTPCHYIRHPAGQRSTAEKLGSGIFVVILPILWRLWEGEDTRIGFYVALAVKPFSIDPFGMLGPKMLQKPEGPLSRCWPGNNFTDHVVWYSSVSCVNKTGAIARFCLDPLI